MALDRAGAPGLRFGRLVETAFARRARPDRPGFEALLSGHGESRTRNADRAGPAPGVRRTLPGSDGGRRSLRDPAPLSRALVDRRVMFRHGVALRARPRYRQRATASGSAGESSDLRVFGASSRCANREDCGFCLRRDRNPQRMGLQHRGDSHRLGDWRRGHSLGRAEDH